MVDQYVHTHAMANYLKPGSQCPSVVLVVLSGCQGLVFMVCVKKGENCICLNL